MKLTKCVNGHFYDEEKFETCPHCAGTSKLNASSIFGQSSAEKPAAEEATAINATVEENNDASAPLEWEPAADESGFTTPTADASASAVEEPEFVDVPKEPGFTAPTADASASAVEEPEFVDVPKESGFTAPPEEPEFVDVPKETGFTAPPEEPEFVDAPKEPDFTAPTADASALAVEEPEFVDKPKEPGFAAPPEEPEFSPAPEAVSVDEEPTFDINSQPSFDTPLDFDNDFAASPVAEETDSAEEEKEEEEEFELLSKYSSDTPAEEAQEASVAMDAEAPAWEMPQPNVEEIKTENQETVESVVDPDLEERPTEIVEEPEADLMNGLLSEEEITGNTSQPAFSAEPEEPEFSPEPEAPVFSPEPETPAFPTEPANPAFVPEQPTAFDLSSDEDDDDDGHTVAFYDDIFNEVSKTAVTTAEAPTQDAFTEAANAAAEVAMNATAANATATNAAPVASETPAASDTGEEVNVFTAPPLPKVQNLPTPCVGWLIALNGAHIGQDFHLRVGKNYVGRDESMDVALTGDKSVSRHKHAIIIYEPKHHKYFVQPGESNELIYVNDEVVLLPMELKPYDLLVIGDIELWFMPLCNAEHNWSEVIRKLQEQMQQ